MGIADPTRLTDMDLGRIKAWASAVAGCDGLAQMRNDWKGRFDGRFLTLNRLSMLDRCKIVQIYLEGEGKGEDGANKNGTIVFPQEYEPYIVGSTPAQSDAEVDDAEESDVFSAGISAPAMPTVPEQVSEANLDDNAKEEELEENSLDAAVEGAHQGILGDVMDEKKEEFARLNDVVAKQVEHTIKQLMGENISAS
ncbi:MAG: hypothetical protein SGPRY_002427 [Prymnesium sp.]